MEYPSTAGNSPKWIFVTKPLAWLQFRLDKLYLHLSDCDGMCTHCHPKVKSRCYRVKEITMAQESNVYGNIPQSLSKCQVPWSEQ